MRSLLFVTALALAVPFAASPTAVGGFLGLGRKDVAIPGATKALTSLPAFHDSKL